LVQQEQSTDRQEGIKKMPLDPRAQEGLSQ